MSDPINRNGLPLGEDLRETMASALGLDVDEGWMAISLTLMEQCVTEPEPRSWKLPAEPGPEVTAVRDPRGRRYEPTSERYRDGRRKWRYWHVDTEGWATVGWDVMVASYGPLTDATGEPA